MTTGIARSGILSGVLFFGTAVAVSAEFVTYEEFGAKGNGTADDFAAICEAHRAANERKLPVKAKAGAVYCIGGAAETAQIRTDVDWTGAKFIIDDTAVEDRGKPVFSVLPSKPGRGLAGEKLGPVKRGTKNLGLELGEAALVVVYNDNLRQFVRWGGNANDGASQREVLIVKPNGDIDSHTPVMQDFAAVTSAFVAPIDTSPLTIRGGHFTTRANHDSELKKYYGRGLLIRRSRTTVDGLVHVLVGEEEGNGKVAPYGGFLSVSMAAGVKLRNCRLAACRNLGLAGTYGITASYAVGLSLYNCTETTDILDRRNWGIIGSNYCRNFVLDSCVLSRFDAHCGVSDAVVRNSTLGHCGITVTGFGRLLVENTTSYGHCFVNLRSDYGAFWNGDVKIKNCTFIPPWRSAIFGGTAETSHDFGYECGTPYTITIDGLKIDDSKAPGATVFGKMDPKQVSADYSPKYPYRPTREVVLNDVMTASGEKLELSPNKFLFKDTVFRCEGRRKWKKNKKWTPWSDSAEFGEKTVRNHPAETSR